MVLTINIQKDVKDSDWQNRSYDPITSLSAFCEAFHARPYYDDETKIFTIGDVDYNTLCHILTQINLVFFPGRTAPIVQIS